LVHALYLAGFAGDARGIDPGRPGVPPFGRAIYHLRGIESPSTNGSISAADRARAAIARKRARESAGIESQEQAAFWSRSYKAFAGRLATTSFAGLVLDYDGTLCDERNRFTGLDRDVVIELVRILRAGVVVGVATGRGGSAGKALRAAIPKQLWKRVVVGYYNGSEVSPLEAEDRPTQGEPGEPLAAVARALLADPRLAASATLEVRRMQIAVMPKPSIPGDAVFAVVSELAEQHAKGTARVVSSSHSVDVLAPGVSKLAVVNAVRERCRTPLRAAVLCVGDRGRWPGNDHALLSEPLSLSVHEVSSDPETCWNVAPPGHRGVQAIVGYLRAIIARAGAFRVAVDKVGRKRT
jgi:hypothetical protein